MSQSGWTDEQRRRFSDAAQREREQQEQAKQTFLASLTDLILAFLRPAVQSVVSSIAGWLAKLFR